MTHLLDTSSLLAHHLAEAGGDFVQSLFDDESKTLGASVLVLLEFEWRLHCLGVPEETRRADTDRYKALIDEVLPVSEPICQRALELRLASSERLPNTDAVIAATASLHNAVLVHRDPHFLAIPASLLSQQPLQQK